MSQDGAQQLASLSVNDDRDAVKADVSKTKLKFTADVGRLAAITWNVTERGADDMYKFVDENKEPSDATNENPTGSVFVTAVLAVALKGTECTNNASVVSDADTTAVNTTDNGSVATPSAR